MSLTSPAPCLRDPRIDLRTNDTSDQAGEAESIAHGALDCLIRLGLPGPSPSAVVRNNRSAGGIEPAQLDAVVIDHGSACTDKAPPVKG